MKRQEGFIFILTLCVITILSLLLLSSMQHVLLFQKGINHQEQAHQQFYQLEFVARQIAFKNPYMRQECLQPHHSPNSVISQLIQNKGCILTVNEIQYRYIVEDLGEYPCLVTLKEDYSTSTHHFRFTLLASLNQSIVQIRIIKPTDHLSCTDRPYLVNTGISSWRYIQSFELESRRS